MAETLSCDGCKMTRVVVWGRGFGKEEKVHCIPIGVLENLRRAEKNGVYVRKEKIDHCDHQTEFQSKT